MKSFWWKDPFALSSDADENEEADCGALNSKGEEELSGSSYSSNASIGGIAIFFPVAFSMVSRIIFAVSGFFKSDFLTPAA